jgi:hypothetical protein
VRRSYHSNLAFIDILFNTLLCFVVFFTLTLIHMKKEDSDSATQGVEFDAYVMIVATWPGEFGDDIDLYIKDPNGGLVFFRQKNNKIMHLDRDDMGTVGELDPGTEDRFYNNREVITIRQSVSGEFIVNAHVYRKSSYGSVPVTIKIMKIRPFKTVYDSVIILDYSGQEKTACRFTVNESGKITDINQLPMRIAQDIVRSEW